MPKNMSLQDNLYKVWRPWPLRQQPSLTLFIHLPLPGQYAPAVAEYVPASQRLQMSELIAPAWLALRLSRLK